MGKQPAKKLMYALLACSARKGPLKLYNFARIMFCLVLANGVLRVKVSGSKKNFFLTYYKYLQKQCLFYIMSFLLFFTKVFVILFVA